jgi:transcription initiation factor TFIIE subunit beta
MSGSSQYKFGVLAKIVKYMRSRHQEGDDHPLSLDEILDETNQLDVGSKVKQVSVKNTVTDSAAFFFRTFYCM